MKRLLPVLVCCVSGVAAAQGSPATPATPATPTAQNNEAPVYEPQNVEVRGDGRCMTVRPGDTVHYTLTIENLGGAHAIYGDLHLRLGRSHDVLRGDLPVPDFRSLGGGGLGVHDPGEAKMYRFAFKVPEAIFGGTYRGVEVSVHADQPQTTSLYRPISLRSPKVDVTRHTREEVHAYCLNVLSSFGAPEARPAVTNFEPGPIDPSAPKPVAPQPMPLPDQPVPVPLQPVPQPR